MLFFRINSKTLSKNPASVTHNKLKIQNSDRTMDGTMVVDIVAVKDVVSFSWLYLSDADLRKLITETQSGAFCTVEYQDGDSPVAGTPKSIVAAAENISYSPHYDYKTGAIVWKDVKVSFTER